MGKFSALVMGSYGNFIQTLIRNFLRFTCRYGNKERERDRERDRYDNRERGDRNDPRDRSDPRDRNDPTDRNDPRDRDDKVKKEKKEIYEEAFERFQTSYSENIKTLDRPRIQDDFDEDRPRGLGFSERQENNRPQESGPIQFNRGQYENFSAQNKEDSVVQSATQPILTLPQQTDSTAVLTVPQGPVQVIQTLPLGANPPPPQFQQLPLQTTPQIVQLSGPPPGGDTVIHIQTNNTQSGELIHVSQPPPVQTVITPGAGPQTIFTSPPPQQHIIVSQTHQQIHGPPPHITLPPGPPPGLPSGSAPQALPPGPPPGLPPSAPPPSVLSHSAPPPPAGLTQNFQLHPNQAPPEIHNMTVPPPSLQQPAQSTFPQPTQVTVIHASVAPPLLINNSSHVQTQLMQAPPNTSLPPPNMSLPPPNTNLPLPNTNLPPPNANLPPPNTNIPPPNMNLPPPSLVTSIANTPQIITTLPPTQPQPSVVQIPSPGPPQVVNLQQPPPPLPSQPITVQQGLPPQSITVQQGPPTPQQVTIQQGHPLSVQPITVQQGPPPPSSMPSYIQISHSATPPPPQLVTSPQTLLISQPVAHIPVSQSDLGDYGPRLAQQSHEGEYGFGPPKVENIENFGQTLAPGQIPPGMKTVMGDYGPVLVKEEPNNQNEYRGTASLNVNEYGSVNQYVSSVGEYGSVKSEPIGDYGSIVKAENGYMKQEMSGSIKRVESQSSDYDPAMPTEGDSPGTVKILNFWTLENFAAIILKFKQSGQTKGFFAQKMQMEW